MVGINAFGGIAGEGDDQADSQKEPDRPGKWSKEALFYSADGDRVVCAKCPHGCVLSDGEMGRCRSRVSYDRKLFSIAYGNPCAVHIDPIEKKPFFHFLPSTRAFSVAIAGCNLRCLNCQNWEISQVSPRETVNYELMPPRGVDECVAAGAQSIAYTYSEPTTFYEYVLDTATLARQRKIRNLLKSNGYINEAPLRKLCKVLDAANIDLKSFDDSVYQRLASASLAPVLRTLKVLHEEGVWLEITNLIIPSWTDDLDAVRRMCEWLVKNGLADAPLHFSRFTPLYKLAHLPATPVSSLEKARDIALESGIKYSYIGNVPGHSGENSYCHSCRKLLLERKGFSIGENHIVKGRCEYCRERIPGVWGS
jgi:pyruvate formate lyase activating enzyme